jgi:hypothetical protein
MKVNISLLPTTYNLYNTYLQLTTPLNDAEKKCFADEEIQLKREAKYAQAGFDLSAWISFEYGSFWKSEGGRD